MWKDLPLLLVQQCESDWGRIQQLIPTKVTLNELKPLHQTEQMHERISGCHHRAPPATPPTSRYLALSHPLSLYICWSRAFYYNIHSSNYLCFLFFCLCLSLSLSLSRSPLHPQRPCCLLPSERAEWRHARLGELRFATWRQKVHIACRACKPHCLYNKGHHLSR